MKRVELVVIVLLGFGLLCYGSDYCFAEDDYLSDSYEYQQDVSDRSSDAWSDYMLDNQDYNNPDTGENVTLSDDYDSAWQSGDDYLQGDYGYDPNSDYSSDWTQLEPVNNF